MATGTTMKANLVVPEVMADMISAALKNKIRFAPLANVDNRLVGVPGDTLTVPAFEYIGDAKDIGEGEAIPLELLTTKKTQMTIKKAAKGVEITDEAVLSGLGDPLTEATNQIAMAIANKVDNDVIDALKKAVQTSPATGGLTLANLDDAIAVFDDEDLEPLVLVANPADVKVLTSDAKKALQYNDIGGNIIVSGALAEVSGAQIVRSRKVEKGTAYLVKTGALTILMKRNALVETDRDIVRKTTVLTGDQHYGAYLYDPTKVVKITIA